MLSHFSIKAPNSISLILIHFIFKIFYELNSIHPFLFFINIFSFKFDNISRNLSYVFDE